MKMEKEIKGNKMKKKKTIKIIIILIVLSNY